MARWLLGCKILTETVLGRSLALQIHKKIHSLNEITSNYDLFFLVLLFLKYQYLLINIFVIPITKHKIFIIYWIKVVKINNYIDHLSFLILFLLNYFTWGIPLNSWWWSSNFSFSYWSNFDNSWVNSAWDTILHFNI